MVMASCPLPITSQHSRSQALLERLLTCISHHPTVEARDKTAMTSLRLLAVLNVLSVHLHATSGSRLVLTALSHTSSPLVATNAGQAAP